VNRPLDDLFGALADPTRRDLFDRLLRTGPQTATSLVAEADLTISRQAVVKHLQTLVDAGLATPTRAGREVRYAATPEPLAAVLAWMMESSPRWDRRIERLVSRAEEISPSAPRPRRTTSTA
jgi:DNA-binding transcriptional ArsR family regulator